MKYAVQYRPRALRGTRKTDWKTVQQFDELTDAEKTRSDAIKYEMKGTKDWRVVPA